MEYEELMHENMLQEAFMDLENGHLMPWDKILLAGSPLPESITQPYTTREVSDVRESMRLTYETMAVWIEESKNESYFSKRFVQLSRMIMNGVTTMGRGLITLHARGEEPGNVPMSVQDLIGVASYQFRKSHLGVLQTVRSHPEISERLMMNQIGWNNMLMRLFKTKEKLAKPVVNAELASNAEGGRRNAESLPDTKSASNHGHALPDAAALFEPCALCAPRAFSSIGSAASQSAGPVSHTSKISSKTSARLPENVSLLHKDTEREGQIQSEINKKTNEETKEIENKVQENEIKTNNETEVKTNNQEETQMTKSKTENEIKGQVTEIHNMEEQKEQTPNSHPEGIIPDKIVPGPGPDTGTAAEPETEKDEENEFEPEISGLTMVETDVFLNSRQLYAEFEPWLSDPLFWERYPERAANLMKMIKDRDVLIKKLNLKTDMATFSYTCRDAPDQRT